MSTPSYSCWATAMVRAGDMFSLRLASCWRVEVVKGGAGWRFFSCRFTFATDHVPAETAEMTASASSWLCSSSFFSLPWNWAWNPPKLGATRSSCASMDQYSWGTKALISCSRSTTSRVATDCTRPADSPRRIFFHSSGES